jgi:ribosomal protein S17E
MSAINEIMHNLIEYEKEDVKKKYLEIYEKYKDRLTGRDLRLDRSKIKSENGKLVGLLYLVYDLLGYGSKAVGLLRKYGKSYVMRYVVKLKKKIPEEFSNDYDKVKEKIIRYAKNLLNEVKISEDLKEKILKEIENTEIDLISAIGATHSYTVYLIYTAQKKLGRMEVLPTALCEKAKISDRIIYYYLRKFNSGGIT